MAEQISRRLVSLLSVLGVVVVAVLVFKFVVSSGDNGGDETTASTASTTTTTAAADEGNGEDGDVDGSDDDTFDVFATKNPFEPVISPISGNGDDNGNGTTTTTTPSDGGTTTSTVPSTNGGGRSSQEPIAPQAVALLDVFVEDVATKARVRVGSSVYTVEAGDVFATSDRVVSLDDPCGQFLFGDSPFELCEGEEVIK